MMRAELTGLSGVVERNVYLVKRYAWWEVAFFVYTVASSYTVVLIAKGVQATGGVIDVAKVTAILLVGAVVWAYLRSIFEVLTETVAWERWEGTIEYTFMAPLARWVHLLGMGVFAVAYGLARAVVLFAVLAAVLRLALPHADYLAAVVVVAVASVSFIGVGMMTAVLPLVSPEKGTQLGFMAQGLLLAVSGVYYDVSVLPAPLRVAARLSPATYALDGVRASIIDGRGLGALGHDIVALLAIGALSIPLGLWVFHRGEVYAKRHGKLKRSG